MPDNQDSNTAMTLYEFASSGIAPSHFTHSVPVFVSGFSNISENESVGEAIGHYDNGRMYAKVTFDEEWAGNIAPNEVECLAWPTSAGFQGEGHSMSPLEIHRVTLKNKGVAANATTEK